LCGVALSLPIATNPVREFNPLEVIGVHICNSSKAYLIGNQRPVGFTIQMDGQCGKKHFATLDDAKRAAFDVIEDRRAEKYLRQLRKRNSL